MSHQTVVDTEMYGKRANAHFCLKGAGRRALMRRCLAGMRFTSYETGGFFDELFEAGDRPRSPARSLVSFIDRLPDGELLRRQQSAERALLKMGITFNVYGDSAGTERIFPFDLVPRIVAATEWSWIERGLKQRIRALNMF